MRTALLTLTVLVAMITFLPTVTVAQQNAKCPVETAAARRIANRFSSGAGYASIRTKYNLPALAPTAVRLLGQNGDNGICGRIARLLEEQAPGLFEVDPTSGVSGWELTFFEAGEHYYAVAVQRARPQGPVSPGSVRVQTGWNSLFVIDGHGRMRVIVRAAV